MERRNYGYARVSTDDQTPTRLRCLKKLQHGDALTVWKLDRLGRSLRGLITTLDDRAPEDGLARNERTSCGLSALEHIEWLELTVE